jgi:hypothetical protein
MGYGGPRQSPVEKLVDVELMKQPVTQYPVTAEQCRDTLDLCGFVRRRLAFLSPLWHVGFWQLSWFKMTDVASGFKVPRRACKAGTESSLSWSFVRAHRFQMLVLLLVVVVLAIAEAIVIAYVVTRLLEPIKNALSDYMMSPVVLAADASRKDRDRLGRPQRYPDAGGLAATNGGERSAALR